MNASPGGTDHDEQIAASVDAPVLVGDFRWRDKDWIVVYWPDEPDFDVVNADVPYVWRGKEVDEREQ